MSKENQIIHFSHIPKCGGTSFRKGLQLAYGDDVLFYYMNPIRHRFKDKLDFICWRLKKRIVPIEYPNDIRIIYGHFCFDDISRSFPSVSIKRGAFFRDPIEWVGSYYFYIYAKYPNEIPDNPLKLIKMLNLRNGFKYYLGNIKIGDLDFVGLTEAYQESLNLYKKIFSKDIKIAYENKTNYLYKNNIKKNSYREYFSSIGILDDVKELMENNILVYNSAKERFNSLIVDNNIELNR